MNGISFLLRPSFVSRLFILTGVIGISAVFAQGQINFRKPDFDTGKRPLAVAAADFNHDGLLDIVTANSDGNSVSILLNDGHGGFLRHTDYPVGHFPIALIAADFNNDGLLDLAVANQGDNTFTVLLGNGNGTFQSTGPTLAGRRPSALAAGDFNRDGKLDLAVVNRDDGTVSVFFGLGNGGFTHNADYLIGSGVFDGFSSGLLAVDLNHDGKLDLVAVNGMSAQAVVLMGKADGTFVPGTTLSANYPAIVGPIAAVDLNQDGNLDLILQGVECDRGGCFGVPLAFSGHGDGAFDPGVNLPVPGDPGVPLAIGDVKGDGVPDVLSGRFVVLVDPATIFNPNGAHRVLPMAPAGLGVAAIVAGDFNGDSKPDIVTANSQDNTISLLLGDGSGTFHQPLRYSANDNPQAIVAADFNGDGVPDIAVGNEIVLGIQIFMADGNGGLKAPVEIATDMDVAQLAVADLNHNGIPDILATGLLNNQPIMRFLPSHGDGTFGAPTDRPVLTDVFSSLALADFDGDGLPDVITIGGSFTAPGRFLHVYFNNGDGTFRDPIDTFLGFQALGIAVADFNHDGKMDVVVGRNNNSILGNIAVFLGDGTGRFRNSANFTAGSVATGDFNHDGIMDFVALPDLFLSNGDGTFRQLKGVFNRGVFSSASGFPHVADMNGDGLPDLVIAEGDHLTVFINNGDGTFQPPAAFNAGGSFDLALADLNHDGLPDIAAVGAEFNNAVSLLLNTGVARDFQLELTPQALALAAGQSVNANLAVVPMGGFSSQITFSCAGMPAHSACTFSPASGAPTGGILNATLTITTQSPTLARLSPGLPGTAALALALPVFGIILAGKRSRRSWKAYAVLAPVMVAGFLLAGCGSVSSSHGGTPGTPPGTYSITVAATGGNPSVTHIQTLVLKVQ